MAAAITDRVSRRQTPSLSNRTLSTHQELATLYEQVYNKQIQTAAESLCDHVCVHIPALSLDKPYMRQFHVAIKSKLHYVAAENDCTLVLLEVLSLYWWRADQQA